MLGYDISKYLKKGSHIIDEMDVEIRKAKREDIPNIKKIDSFGRILNSCSPLDRLGPKNKPEKGEKSYYEKFILGKNKWCYVAEGKDGIVGFILFNIEDREQYWAVKRIGYLDLIFVDKKARCKGISKILMEKAFEVLKQRKIDYIKLSVQTENGPAINIWKKFGFKEFRVDMYKRI